MDCSFDYFTLPKTITANRHLKIGLAPKGNDRIPTIHFQVLLLLVSGRVFSDHPPQDLHFTINIC